MDPVILDYSLLAGWVMAILADGSFCSLSSLFLSVFSGMLFLPLSSLSPLHMWIFCQCSVTCLFSLWCYGDPLNCCFSPSSYYLYGTERQLSALACLQVGNKLSDIITWSSLILTKRCCVKGFHFKWINQIWPVDLWGWWNTVKGKSDGTRQWL